MKEYLSLQRNEDGEISLRQREVECLKPQSVGYSVRNTTRRRRIFAFSLPSL
jgi:hypothetical protein